MTSFRQFEANRRNAQSTGPKSLEGKRMSRRSASVIQKGHKSHGGRATSAKTEPHDRIC